MKTRSLTLLLAAFAVSCSSLTSSVPPGTTLTVTSDPVTKQLSLSGSIPTSAGTVMVAPVPGTNHAAVSLTTPAAGVTN